MEHVRTDAAFPNLFWDARIGQYPWSGSTVSSNWSSAPVGDVTTFHGQAVEWNTANVYWYIDDVRVKTQRMSAFNHGGVSAKLLRDFEPGLFRGLAGARSVKSDLLLYMYVDCVRVYRQGSVLAIRREGLTALVDGRGVGFVAPNGLHVAEVRRGL